MRAPHKARDVAQRLGRAHTSQAPVRCGGRDVHGGTAGRPAARPRRVQVRGRPVLLLWLNQDHMDLSTVPRAVAHDALTETSGGWACRTSARCCTSTTTTSATSRQHTTAPGPWTSWPAGHVYIARYTFPLAVQVVESGRLALDVLITHRIPLRDSHSGIDLLRRGEAVKVISNQFGMGDAGAEYPATHGPESR